MLLLCLAPMPYGYFQLVRFVAMVVFGLLLPQWFTLPFLWESHGSRVNDRIFGKQFFDVLGESVGRVDRIEPVCDIAQVGIKFVTVDLSVSNPWIRKMVGNVGLNNDIRIPKTAMVGTYIADNRNATQPVSHILELGYHETSANSFLSSVVTHVAIKFGKGSHRCHLHRLPNRRHGGAVILPKVFQNIFIFRTVKFILQALEVTREQGAAICQCRVHKPECFMAFCKQTNHSGTNGDFNLLNRREEKKSQFLVKMVEVNDLRKLGTRLKSMLLLVYFHQSPISCQTKITDGVKSIFSFSIIFNLKPSLLQNVNLLLERKQLLSISHSRINKKWPALVRYIPCGREAAAGSIECKSTAFTCNIQIFF